jgi:hypothetical protein
MSQFIAPKSNQLNADDLISGPRNITVTSVSANPGNAEQPVAVSFEGDNGKPYLPCKSMRRVMVAIWGKDASQYTGRSMTLYRDPEVTWGGMKVGGIRISHMTDMDGPVTLALTATQKQRKPYRVEPLVVQRGPDKGAVQAEARAEAQKGTDAFRAWWSANPEKRDAAKEIMPELQKAASDADAARTADDNDDPFGLPPTDDTPALTPEQEAAIQREIEEETRMKAEGVGE